MTEQQQTPAGWYPDPSGAPGQRYWDGQQWTGDPVPAAPKPQGFSRKTTFIILGVLAALVLVAVIGALGGGSDDSSTAASSTSTTDPVFIPKPSTPVAAPVAPVVECSAADPDLVAQIEGQLGGGYTLADAFQVDSAESGYLYVGGNIMQGETKVSSSDVWIAQDGSVLYALSGTAREMTPLADGRDLGLSAGDEFGMAVQECTQVAERARNAGGN